MNRGESFRRVIKSDNSAKANQSNLCPAVTQKSVDYAKFFEDLNKNSPNSAVLVTQEKYYKRFIPK